MAYNFIKRMIICFLIGIFMLITVGCATNRATVGYEEDSNQGYNEPGNSNNQKKGGPPDHAPAYGYRPKHQYRYYPEHRVYHDTERGLYFYLRGDNWEVGGSLPTMFRDGLGESVILEMETDRPYIYNAKHVKQYPPGQLKKKNKSKERWIYGLAQR